ncbi:hypothetical protein PR003_g5719 [Phytophthora rubi]|uniref:Uncharacterized protein n=1 Tax=Phytophthora rubi TaxID=129364 RepID=A0A6A4FYZ1_9STRA|nr:hypothetical protein PF003_g579 [Phytophthora fragariae]KAE9349771.1 hypothetical protein PR003_g5719 [Phytophthora rubi]
MLLLQLGLLDSSFIFVSNFRNHSLAYVLADAGFDVCVAWQQPTLINYVLDIR